MRHKIRLSKVDIHGSEIEYLKEAFEKRQISNYGDNLIHFEKDLEHFLGQNKKAVCVTSGTAAIHLALIMAGVVAGDEVICQSMTYIASVSPIKYLGAIPVFVGSETDTWNMCPNHLEMTIKDRISKGKKPKAIIVVHSYGMPAQIDTIAALAKKYNIVLIEDAAEALGSTFKGQKCGTFGDFGILSFNGNKIITTSGGGALICKNDEIQQKTIFLATHAKDDAPHYQHSEIGYNYRMSNIVAGVGRGQIEALDAHIRSRREVQQFYKNIFKDVAGVMVLEEPNDDYFSNHWLSCIIVDKKVTGFSSEDIRLALWKDNIESRPLWKPMHMQPIFEKYTYYGTNFCEELFKKGLCLPSGPNLTIHEKERITQVITTFVV